MSSAVAIAAIPDENAWPSSAPSSSAQTLPTSSTVGLASREYVWPGSSPAIVRPSSSAVSKANVVALTIGCTRGRPRPAGAGRP